MGAKALQSGELVGVHSQLGECVLLAVLSSGCFSGGASQVPGDS